MLAERRIRREPTLLPKRQASRDAAVKTDDLALHGSAMEYRGGTTVDGRSSHPSLSSPSAKTKEKVIAKPTQERLPRRPTLDGPHGTEEPFEASDDEIQVGGRPQ